MWGFFKSYVLSKDLRVGGTAASPRLSDLWLTQFYYNQQPMTTIRFPLTVWLGKAPFTGHSPLALHIPGRFPQLFHCDC